MSERVVQTRDGDDLRIELGRVISAIGLVRLIGREAIRRGDAAPQLIRPRLARRRIIGVAKRVAHLSRITMGWRPGCPAGG